MDDLQPGYAILLALALFSLIMSFVRRSGPAPVPSVPLVPGEPEKRQQVIVSIKDDEEKHDHDVVFVDEKRNQTINSVLEKERQDAAALDPKDPDLEQQAQWLLQQGELASKDKPS